MIELKIQQVYKIEDQYYDQVINPEINKINDGNYIASFSKPFNRNKII